MVHKFIWIGLLLLVIGCQSPQCPANGQAFLDDYHLLMQDVSKLDRYISTKEWEPYDKRFEQLVLQCYPQIQPELSDSLDRAVWLDAITFAMNRHRYDVQKIIQDTTDQTLIVIRDHMRKLWDNPYTAFEEIFRRQTGQEFMDALQEVKKTPANNETMYDVLLSFITSFTLTFVAIPSIINVARVKHLMDEPGERRSHSDSIPTLGGIGIFAGVIFSIVLWTPFGVFQDLQYILCAFVIIFLIGVKDDLVPMSPWRKLAGQLFAAFILVYKANVRLTSFYGLFGLTLLPDWVSYSISIFTILVIINAFNLIDGINGLTGSISTLISLVLGIWFFLVDRIDLAIVAFALAGSVLAFMRYNVTPAKIFMGDTGSLFVGLVCAILAIKFIEAHRELPDSIYAVNSAPAVAIGILILPLFDTLRVFIIRILRGHSPLSPDRRHIHHMMIDAGFSHMQATGILIFSNIVFILIALKFQNLGNFMLLIIILGLALVLTAILHFYVRRKKAQQRKFI